MGRKEIHRGILVADRTHLGEITSMLKDRVHGLDDGANVRLRADATDAHLSGLLGQLVGEMNCDHQDRNVRKQVRDLPGNVNPVYIRHLEVQQDHIRGMFLNPFERFSSCGSFVANPPGASLFEEASKIMSHRRVVIYHKNSNQAGPSFHSSHLGIDRKRHILPTTAKPRDSRGARHTQCPLL